MNNDTLLFYAMHLKEFCKKKDDCETCIFDDKGVCRLEHLPVFWEIDELTKGDKDNDKVN